MEIEFYGANCLVLSTKSARLVIDDNLEELGSKSVTKDNNVILFTSSHGTVKDRHPKLVIDSPGEYEISGINVKGIPAQSHLENNDVKNSTMYKIECNDVSVLVTGHVFPKLSDHQLEEIGLIDIVCIPVGGNGYTLDPTSALQLVKEIEPHAVILTHYDDKDLNFAVPQKDLNEALAVFSMDPTITTNKLKLKSGDYEGGNIDLIMLTKS